MIPDFFDYSCTDLKLLMTCTHFHCLVKQRMVEEVNVINFLITEHFVGIVHSKFALCHV